MQYAYKLQQEKNKQVAPHRWQMLHALHFLSLSYENCYCSKFVAMRFYQPERARERERGREGESVSVREKEMCNNWQEIFHSNSYSYNNNNNNSCL